MGLYLERQTYPNETFYWEFILDGQLIGKATEKEGLYLVWGKRKPVSKKHAAKQMIDDHLNRLENELQDWRKLMLSLKKAEGSL